MEARKRINRFQLKQQTILDDHIRTKTRSQIMPAIAHGNLYLTRYVDATLRQLKRQRPLIGRFEQTRPKLSMHGNGRIDHAAHDLLSTVDKGFSFVLFVFFVARQSLQSSNWLLMRIASSIVVRPRTTWRTASRRSVSPAIWRRAALTKAPVSSLLIAATMSLLISSIS